MIIKGFIAAVGQPREWSNNNGEKMQSTELTLAIPFVTRNGEERNDMLMGEMSFGNPDFLKVLQSTCDAHEKCEFQVGFYLSDWNGKKIQNIRVHNLTKLMM